jgi:hypothetical protein
LDFFSSKVKKKFYGEGHSFNLCRLFVDFDNAGFWPVVGVLDEPYSQLTPLIGVAGQARQST